MDISKAIDKRAGAEREVIDSYKRRGRSAGILGKSVEITRDVTLPATPEAQRWAGWGTALKPANEPIVLARKPLSERTIAANVLKWGTGGLNIDGSRIAGSWERSTEYRQDNRGGRFHAGADVGKISIPPQKSHERGRFPANVLLDEVAAAALDEQSGELKSGELKGYTIPGASSNGHLAGKKPRVVTVSTEDKGGASRFYYVAKASKKERTHGGKVENKHPTVKPIKLMEYLVTLITPPGGIVLDPFCGSGSTLIAARNLGFDFIGIDMSEEYVALTQARLAAVRGDKEPSQAAFAF